MPLEGKRLHPTSARDAKAVIAFQLDRSQAELLTLHPFGRVGLIVRPELVKEFGMLVDHLSRLFKEGFARHGEKLGFVRGSVIVENRT